MDKTIEKPRRINIDPLLEKIDIVEYISEFIDLEESGNGEYIALSPFSGKDINPSFTITPQNGLWYDFSFGKGGNVISFIQYYNKVSFYEALKIACDYIGVGIESIPRQLDIVGTIKKFVKPKTKISQTKHKILNKDIMNNYEFDIEKLQIWIDEGMSIEVLKRYQVMYDRVSNRICFPIFDINGNIIDIKGRSLDKEFKRKYTYFYGMGDLDTLYNFAQRKDNYLEKNEIILFESEKSCLLAETYGITNTAAIMTSHLSPPQLPILCKLGVNVVFALDSDIDPRDDKRIQALKRFVRVDYIWNYGKLMADKQSPIDINKKNFDILYEHRKRML